MNDTQVENCSYCMFIRTFSWKMSSISAGNFSSNSFHVKGKNLITQLIFSLILHEILKKGNIWEEIYFTSYAIFSFFPFLIRKETSLLAFPLTKPVSEWKYCLILMSYSLKKYVSTSNIRVVYRINILYYTLCVCACVCLIYLWKWEN